MSEEIFISYSSKDSTIVEQIVELFKSNNISYWFAPEKLTGKKHDEAIVPAIKNCKIFMIFLSENSRPREGFKTSTWVRDELLTAREYESFFLPIKLDYTVDLETNNLMFKGLPNYFDLTLGQLMNRINELKDFVNYLLIDDKYKDDKFAVENFQKEKSKKLFKDIEKSLKNSFLEQSETILINNPFLKSIDPNYYTLIETIIMMSKKPIKDMDINSINLISKKLNSLEDSEYSNVAIYLESMITKSYFDFNGIRNDYTRSFNTLKQTSKEIPIIKAKYFLLTRCIKNVLPNSEYELSWV